MSKSINMLFLPSMVQFRLWAHEHYASIMEGNLKTATRDFEKKIEEIKNKMPKNMSELENQIKYTTMHIYYPQILRYSLFLSCISIFEYSMIEICDEIKKKKDIRIDPRSLKDELPNTFRKFLEDVARIKFPKENWSWRDIIYYYKIRNFIIHRHGKIDKSSNAKAIRKKFKTGKIIVERDSIKLKKGFEISVLKVLSAFFEELFKILS